MGLVLSLKVIRSIHKCFGPQVTLDPDANVNPHPKRATESTNVPTTCKKKAWRHWRQFENGWSGEGCTNYKLPCLALPWGRPTRGFSGDWVNVVMPWESWMASSKKLSRARGVSTYLLYYCIYRACEDHPQSDLVLRSSLPSVYLALSLGVGNAESSPSQLHYILPLLWVGT